MAPTTLWDKLFPRWIPGLEGYSAYDILGVDPYIKRDRATLSRFAHEVADFLKDTDLYPYRLEHAQALIDLFETKTGVEDFYRSPIFYSQWKIRDGDRLITPEVDRSVQDVTLALGSILIGFVIGYIFAQIEAAR